jgi:hypothetical protein
MLARKTIGCCVAAAMVLVGCVGQEGGSELGSSGGNESESVAEAGAPLEEPAEPEPERSPVAEAPSAASTPAAPVPPPEVVVTTPVPVDEPEADDDGAPPPEPVPPPPESAPDSGLSDEPEPPPEPEPVEPEVDPDWPFDAMNDPIENPTTCPEVEPVTGQGCSEASLVCKYGSELNCRSRWICQESGTWILNYGPRDCPESCPDTEPAEGDPCEVDRAVCDFGEDPACAAQWLCWEGVWARTFAGDCTVETTCPETPPESGATCTVDEVTPPGGKCIYEGGSICGCGCSWFEESELAPTIAWWCSIVSSEYPPDYLTACPVEVPEPGTPCDTGVTCGYPNNDMCTERYAGSTLASCVDGVWALSMELPL